MQKQAPTLGRVLVMAGFALSCFGLLLYLWVAFGGGFPLKPQGYRFHVHFTRGDAARRPGRRAHLRVPVGKVVNIALGPNDTTDATIQLDQRYAPIPEDVRATCARRRCSARRSSSSRPVTRAAARCRRVARCPTRRSRDGPARRDPALVRPRTRRALPGLDAVARAAGSTAAARTSTPRSATSRRSPRTRTTLLQQLDDQRQALQQLVVNTGHRLRRAQPAQQRPHRPDPQLERRLRHGRLAQPGARQIFRAFPTFEHESTLTLNRLNVLHEDSEPDHHAAASRRARADARRCRRRVGSRRRSATSSSTSDR